MSPRAAGDSTHYTFTLNNRPEVQIRLPSVTSIIKSVMSPAFGPASYWGFKLGVGWGMDQLDGPQYQTVDEAYETAKKSEFAPNNQRDKGASRGTAAHDLLEVLANGKEPENLEDKYQEAVAQWWLDKGSKVEIIACEVPVFSLKHQYAGTVDLIYREGSQLTFCDLKTHKGKARLEDHLQVAAYDMAWREMEGEEDGFFSEHMVLLAREDGTYTESVRWTDPDVFLKVREVYREVENYG